MNIEQSIKVKAMCLFARNGKVLASPGYDKSVNVHFYRLPGGKLEYGETAEQAIRREAQEELNSGINHLRFLEVVENIFMFEGRHGHEVVFLYSGELAKSELYNQSVIHFTDGENKYEAHWINIQEVLNGNILLYPEFDYKRRLTIH